MSIADFRENAMKLFVEANDLDSKKQYPEALAAYMRCTEAFFMAIKHETIPQNIELMKKRASEIVSRAEQIKDMLSKQKGSAGEIATANGASSTTTANNLIMTESPNVSWDDIVGLEDAKKLLRTTVLGPILLPDLYDKDKNAFIQPLSGALLFGPPGTGKTLLGKAIASEAGIKFISVSMSGIFTKYVGDSEKNIKQIFESARNAPPACVVFIDEVEALGRSRSDGDSEVQARTMSEILAQIDGIQSNRKDSRVIVLATTNRPNSMDDALLRRLQKRIYIPLPGAKARKSLFERILKRAEKQCEVLVTSADIDAAVGLTRLYSAADIDSFSKTMSTELMSRLFDATAFMRHPTKDRYIPCDASTTPDCIKGKWDSLPQEIRSKLATPALTAEIFLSTLKSTKPTIREDSLQEYTQFASERGVAGGETDDD